MINSQHGLLMVCSSVMGRVEPTSVEAWLGIIIVPPPTWGGTRVLRERDSFVLISQNLGWLFPMKLIMIL